MTSCTLCGKLRVGLAFTVVTQGVGMKRRFLPDVTPLKVYVAIQYVPDTDVINISKVEASDFENAWLKTERRARKRLFSESVLLTNEQFVKLVKKIRGFLGDFERG